MSDKTNDLVMRLRCTLPHPNPSMAALVMEEAANLIEQWEVLSLVEMSKDRERLRNALMPFAVAADQGERARKAFEEAKYGLMDCRDAFMQGAGKSLSMQHFRDAVAAMSPLTALEQNRG